MLFVIQHYIKRITAYREMKEHRSPRLHNALASSNSSMVKSFSILKSRRHWENEQYISFTATCHLSASVTSGVILVFYYSKSKFKGNKQKRWFQCCVFQSTALNLSLIACSIHKCKFSQQGRIGLQHCDKGNSLLKICTHQENDSENSCSTKPRRNHFQGNHYAWKGSVLEEEIANGDPDTCGCLWKKNTDEAVVTSCH